MDLIEEAYSELYPEKGFGFETSLKYSGKFSSYNANIRMVQKGFTKRLELRLSREWKGVQRDIVKGLIQSLMVRLFKGGKKTTAMDLYHIFLKNVHIAIPKDAQDPVLLESFERVNDQFLYGQMEAPNLVWGTASFHKFGSYDYGTDTITMSAILEGEQELLDYVMYHEMLHKKHKFSSTGRRSRYHSAAFRKDEKAYPNAAELERSLSRLAAKKRIRSIFGF